MSSTDQDTSWMQARIDQLTAANAELSRKVSQLRSSNGALMVDADRREQRARLIAEDCEAHGREIQYLRHCASWYWQSMNDSDEARQAVVTANMLTARNLREHGADATVKAADVAGWLDKNTGKQDKALRRHGYPTLADCLRSTAGKCEHDGLSSQVKADIVKELGLTS
jgi:hypothetical protein